MRCRGRRTGSRPGGGSLLWGIAGRMRDAGWGLGGHALSRPSTARPDHAPPDPRLSPALLPATSPTCNPLPSRPLPRQLLSRRYLDLDRPTRGRDKPDVGIQFAFPIKDILVKPPYPRWHPVRDCSPLPLSHARTLATAPHLPSGPLAARPIRMRNELISAETSEPVERTSYTIAS